MFYHTLAFLLAFAFSIAFYLRIKRHIQHSTIPSILFLLKPPNVPLGLFLHASARPDQRLVGAFFLTNTFVKEDKFSHAQFRNGAQSLLAKASDWPKPKHEEQLNTEHSRLAKHTQKGSGKDGGEPINPPEAGGGCSGKEKPKPKNEEGPVTED
ncbi:uncharacterized protein BT62DRAFT_915430 [Guyanagaster necrorhizus]|uniref:Uncharacterized protein n=1 Tax=Guyanagaster necrorhizus TaxID=856835 RepID=A0A9P7W5T0_9AGAR|nr:uncharacterized protein BT62DRAFT_915430 [Guyanagaster necrorhizus MCA 3950]KAG7453122.1 hypothetical protein BT62DRAFT_915430 [Guyanagaster necrorhizus MCA 3950]